MPFLSLRDPDELSGLIQSKNPGGKKEFVVADSSQPLPEGGLVYHDEEERDMMLDLYTKKEALPVQVYQFDGLPPFYVEESYDKELEKIRDLKIAAFKGKSAAKKELGKNPLAKVALPEQVARILSSLPDTGHIKEVRFARHREIGMSPAQGVSPQEASADADTQNGVIRFFSQDRSIDTTRVHAQHEYTHLLEKEKGFELFKKAIVLEGSAWHYRDYAKTNEHEDFAVHGGEVFMNQDSKHLQEMIEKSPARALALAAAYKEALEMAKNKESPHAKVLQARISASLVLAGNKFADRMKESLSSNNKDQLQLQNEFLEELGGLLKTKIHVQHIRARAGLADK